LNLPHCLSKSAKSLLTSLLNRNPSKRIGAGPRGAEEIKEHLFFKDIDWNKVYNKEYKVPEPHIRNIKQNNPMAASIFDDLGVIDDNRLPGWSFIHYGASEVIPSYSASLQMN
jgi:serine/threonine protein kinase